MNQNWNNENLFLPIIVLRVSYVFKKIYKLFIKTFDGRKEEANSETHPTFGIY